MAIRYAKFVESLEQLSQLISPLFPDFSCSSRLNEIGFSALIYALDIHTYTYMCIHIYVYVLKIFSIVSRSRGASDKGERVNKCFGNIVSC